MKFLSSAIEDVVFRLSMRAHRPDNASPLSHREATFSVEAYDDWRCGELSAQFRGEFDVGLIRGKRVLDFGCGSGDLSFFAADAGAAGVVGIDLSSDLIDRAEARRTGVPSGDIIRFARELKTDSISLPDASVDVILCFDVLEHIMEYERIIGEWRRVLAPGGRVLIWWSVWWHPYGHHLHTMIPLPWVHAVLDDAAMHRVCARIYDSPHFRPRLWHLDAEGRRKPNPHVGATTGYLNRLTISGFERAVRRAGLRVERKTVHPFSGQRLGGIKRALARLPWPDAFCSHVAYEIASNDTGPP